MLIHYWKHTVCPVAGSIHNPTSGPIALQMHVKSVVVWLMGEIRGENTTKSGKEKGLKDWIRPQVGDNPKTFCRFCKCETQAHHKGITYIVCHTCTNSADHLCGLIGKCTALNNHPTAACMFKELQRDIGEARYSFVIDKSKESCVYLFGIDSPASEKSLQLLK